MQADARQESVCLLWAQVLREGVLCMLQPSAAGQERPAVRPVHPNERSRHERKSRLLQPGHAVSRDRA